MPEHWLGRLNSDIIRLTRDNTAAGYTLGGFGAGIALSGMFGIWGIAVAVLAVCCIAIGCIALRDHRIACEQRGEFMFRESMERDA